jgi:hypothetical protein
MFCALFIIEKCNYRAIKTFIRYLTFFADDPRVKLANEAAIVPFRSSSME